MSTSKGWGELNDMLQVAHGTLSIRVLVISFCSSIVLRQSVKAPLRKCPLSWASRMGRISGSWDRGGEEIEATLEPQTLSQSLYFFPLPRSIPPSSACNLFSCRASFFPFATSSFFLLTHWRPPSGVLGLPSSLTAGLWGAALGLQGHLWPLDGDSAPGSKRRPDAVWRILPLQPVSLLRERWI